MGLLDGVVGWVSLMAHLSVGIARNEHRKVSRESSSSSQEECMEGEFPVGAWDFEA